MMEDDYYEEGQRGSGSSMGKFVFLALLSVVILPAAVIAWFIYYIFLQILKWRMYVSTVVLVLLEVILLLVFKASGSLSGLSNIIEFNFNSEFFMSFISWSLLLGIPFGITYIGMKVSSLKRNPELRALKGWAQGFEYALTPIELIREKVNKKRLFDGLEFNDDCAPIGILDKKVEKQDQYGVVSELDDNTAKAIIYRYYEEAFKHTLITGATGSGKTVTMLQLIYNDIRAGLPVCIIDFKKSADFIYFMSKWAKENNRPFYHFQSGKLGSYKNPLNDEQATYDPLSSGSATAKADMILSLRSWDASSEVFKKRTQDILQSVFFLLERTPEDKVPGIDWGKGGFAEFVSALDVRNLTAMIEVMNDDNMMGKLNPGDIRRLNTLSSLHEELSKRGSSALRDQINELISICRTLIVSDYGDWIASGASKKHIELMNIATSDDENPPVVLFSFNQQEEPEFARYMGGIVMSDLSRVAAQKGAKNNKNPFGVYIDEFQSLDPSSVTDSLEKSRSARIFITLSLQSLEQIVSASSGDGEAQAGSIIETCSNFIFHDGMGYDTALRIAKIAGEVDRYTYKTTSKVNNSIFSLNFLNNRKAVVSKEIGPGWLFEPKEIQSQSSPISSNNWKSTAYVINKNVSDDRFTRIGGGVGRQVQVIVPDEISSGAPKSFIEEAKLDIKVETKSFEEIQEEVNEDIYGDFEITETSEFDDIPSEDFVPTNESIFKEMKQTSFQQLQQPKSNAPTEEKNEVPTSLPKLR